jgi:hypothetical protein
VAERQRGVGVIGCGNIANKQHLPNYARNPRTRVVAVADVDPERARVTAEAVKPWLSVCAANASALRWSALRRRQTVNRGVLRRPRGPARRLSRVHHSKLVRPSRGCHKATQRAPGKPRDCRIEGRSL